MSRPVSLALILPLAFALIAWLFPVPLPAGYHAFADHSAVGLLHPFGDTVSNLAFLFAGIFIWTRADLAHEKILAIALGLTCLGSWYYHLAPTDLRLLVDRLPMAPAFAAMGACALFNRQPCRALAFTLVFSALFMAAATVALTSGSQAFWVVSQIYVLLLALSALANPELRNAALSAFALYVGAKLTETFDHQILEITQIVSGHTIKHLLAALAPVLWFMLRKPMTVQNGSGQLPSNIWFKD